MYRSKKRQEEAKITLKSLRKRETEEDDGNTEEAGTSLTAAAPPAPEGSREWGEGHESTDSQRKPFSTDRNM